MNAKKKEEIQTDRQLGGREKGRGSEREGGTTQHNSATMGTHSKKTHEMQQNILQKGEKYWHK